MLLGAQKKTLQGFSKLQMLPHTGFIFYAQIVQDLVPEFRRKAAKLVSAKLTLAARVDCFHESDDGSVGKKLLDQIFEKFDKWQEPPPTKQTKVRIFRAHIFSRQIFRLQFLRKNCISKKNNFLAEFFLTFFCRLCPYRLRRRVKSVAVAALVK